MMKASTALLGALCAAIVPACSGDPTIDDRTAELDLAPQPPDPGAGACQVVSSVHDIDVPRVALSGDFTVNNAAPSPYDSQTAIVELRSETLGVVELGLVNEGSYSTWIIPGVYDVVYRHQQGTLLPQNAETIVLEDVNLEAGGTFDIALTSVLVMGDITINGGPAPQGFYEHGTVRMRDRITGAEFDLGDSIDGEYFAMVMPGLYDVVWHRLAGGTEVPANQDAIIIEEVLVDGLTELDIDVPGVVRTGQIRINGAAPPAGFYENGWVSLRDTRTGDITRLGQTRDQSYSKMIVPGAYDVLYENLLGTTQVPQNKRAVVATEVFLLADGDLTIDIPMVTISGVLSLDGNDFPNGFYDRARIRLHGADEADRFNIATTSTRTYSARIVPGTYDVAYELILSQGLVPENPYSVVSSGHTFAKKGFGSSHTLDIDVASGWVATDVTAWGQAMPASFYENGLLSATEQDGDGEPVDLGTTNDGGGAARVLAGAYDLRYGHMIGSAVPANTNAVIGAAQSAAAVAPVQVDLHPGTMSGAFSQGGQPFPAAAGQSADVRLRDAVSGDEVALGNTADGTFSTALLSGSYELVYEHLGGNALVANRGAMLGCVTFEPPAPVVPVAPIGKRSNR